MEDEVYEVFISYKHHDGDGNPTVGQRKDVFSATSDASSGVYGAENGPFRYRRHPD
jgi:hypothetical protein